MKVEPRIALPPGVEDPRKQPPEVPKGIIDSFKLLHLGMQHGTLSLMQKVMNDSDEVIYDLGVGVPHPLTQEMRWFTIARVIPQHEKEQPINESDSAPAVPPSDPVD